jgi:hypothetical protein
VPAVPASAPDPAEVVTSVLGVAARLYPSAAGQRYSTPPWMLAAAEWVAVTTTLVPPLLATAVQM